MFAVLTSLQQSANQDIAPGSSNMCMVHYVTNSRNMPQAVISIYRPHSIQDSMQTGNIGQLVQT
uniref:Uncharacterized protein n=1 Tax=Heterorhabditis bacteriophora TaxID=37862 RepID=A0A1I7XEE2_HETBA